MSDGKPIADTKYLPLSMESFNELWDSNCPFDWCAVLENVTYCPPGFLKDDELWDKLVITEDVKYDFPYSQENFIRVMLEHPLVPERYMRMYFKDYSYAILDNPNVTQGIIDILITESSDRMVALEAACHPMATILTAIPVLSEEWENISLPSWNEERARAETNINTYLADLGWDKETLELVPLQMKLKAIRY